MFRKNLFANDKFPIRNFENMSSPNQMQESFKPETFSDSFIRFLESTSIFKQFEKKDDRHSYFISEIGHCERVG